MLSAVLLSRICKRFADGKNPFTIEELQQVTGIPVRIVNDLLFKMIESRLVIEISVDEKGESSQYVPAESLQNLNVGVMIDRLESKGSWKIDLPIGLLLNKKWKQIINSRVQYLHSLRQTPLEDLAEG